MSSLALDNAADVIENDSEKIFDEQTQAADAGLEEGVDDGLGGMEWECVAVSLNELLTLLSSISDKKDPNERILHEKLTQHLLPILEQQEEKRKKREKEREKELLNLAKMANAKRSSRIAGRQEQQRQEESLREAEQKRRLEIEAQRKEEQRQRKVEKEREARLLSRETRLHDREVRRAQHEDDLANLTRDSTNLDHLTGRISERKRQAEIEKNLEALRELEEEGEEEEWAFDCVCGLHGKVDDGQHSVSCETCNIWQHSKCLGIDEYEAEKDDFHFVCDTCKKKAGAATKDAANGRPVIRIKLNTPSTESAAELPTEPSVTNVPSPGVQTSVKRPPDEYSANKDIRLSPPSESSAPESAFPTLSAPLLVKSSPRPYAESGDTRVLTARLPVLDPPASDNNIGSIPIKTNGFASLPTLTSAADLSPGSVMSPDTMAPVVAHREPTTHLSSLPHPALSQANQSPRRPHTYEAFHEKPISMPDSGASPPATNSVDPPTPTAAIPSAGSVQGAPFQRTPKSFATPRLHHVQRDIRAGNKVEVSTSPLPSHGGFSPTKHSPTLARDQTSILHGNTLSPSLLPPTASLSPSTPEQILTPPVKPGGPAHRQSFSGLPTDLVPQPKDLRGAS